MNELETAQYIDQAAYWLALIVGGAAIALIAIYETHSRQKKQ